jgi:molybdopterin-binding protein
VALSARNQFTGTVKTVVLGSVVAEVVVEVGQHEIVSVVTRHSVESLGIRPGDTVTAVINATEVMLEK